MATKDQIANLKAQWTADPTWDIETTPDFEAHHDELLAFRKATEARWESERLVRLIAKAGEIGCPGNLKLAAYVERLERRIAKLEGEDT
jgi:hypothetical protein